MSGFGVWVSGLGFQVPGSGAQVSGSGFGGRRVGGADEGCSGIGFRVPGLGSRVSGSGFGETGRDVLAVRTMVEPAVRATGRFGFRVSGFGFCLGFGARGPGFGFRVSDFGFRVER